MPITPFIGLSVLVHMMVIVGHRLLAWLPWQPRKFNPQVTIFKHLVAVMIIVLMSVAILTNASFLILAGFASPYSSPKLISKLFDQPRLTSVPFLALNNQCRLGVDTYQGLTVDYLKPVIGRLIAGLSINTVN